MPQTQQQLPSTATAPSSRAISREVAAECIRLRAEVPCWFCRINQALDIVSRRHGGPGVDWRAEAASAKHVCVFLANSSRNSQ